MSEVFKEKSELGIKLREKGVKIAETNRKLKSTKENDSYMMCSTVGEDRMGSGAVALLLDKKWKSRAEGYCCVKEGTV
jgi:hypothetical protein